MENETKGLNISVKTFLVAIAVIGFLMVVTYGLTFLIPSGEYARIPDANGNMIIDTASGYKTVDGGIEFWRWLLSPILVLTAEGNVTLIAVIIFIIVIGGVFGALDSCGLLEYMLSKIANTFKATRYKLMAVMMFFFMALGALIGSFEEVVPLVPIIVSLSIALGWDALTGLGMSLLAVGCGFASGVCNPFTVGVAQGLAGLPMFSGMWLRLLSFFIIYALVFGFVYLRAKKIEKPMEEVEKAIEFNHSDKMERGLKLFAIILAVGIGTILLSPFIKVIQDYTLIIVAVTFLAAGIASTLASGMTGKELGKDFLAGIKSMLPAVVMILMASSIKYTLDVAKTLDTILYYAVNAASTLPRWEVVLFIYLIVLVMNFFIGSGSAKAFMLIPIIVPLAQVFNIPAQLCIVAFAFGDGFSNVLYPTNAALLISLGLADVSYGKWFKWTIKFQLINLVITSLLLLFGLATNYGIY